MFNSGIVQEADVCLLAVYCDGAAILARLPAVNMHPAEALGHCFQGVLKASLVSLDGRNQPSWRLQFTARLVTAS